MKAREGDAVGLTARTISGRADKNQTSTPALNEPQTKQLIGASV